MDNPVFDATPCAVIAYFNNDRVTCQRDHGHFGPHRAMLPQYSAAIFQDSEHRSRYDYSVAVMWESR